MEDMWSSYRRDNHNVTPRRALCNPSTWKTNSTVQKDMLLNTIGDFRITEGFCCKSGKPLEISVDRWRNGSPEPSFPMLWIGRSTFAKRGFRIPSSPAPRAVGDVLRMQAAGDQQHVEDAVAGGVQPRGARGPPYLDGGRAEGGDPGAPYGECGDATKPSDEVGHQPQHAGAQDEGQRDGGGVSARNHQGQLAKVDSRQPCYPRDGAHEDRQVQGVRVPGDTEFLRRVGVQGGAHEWEPAHRAGPLREMVGQREGQEQLHDHHHRGELGGALPGHGCGQHVGVERLGSGQAVSCRKEHGGIQLPEQLIDGELADEQTQRLLDQGQRDGGGGGRGHHEGDPGPRGETCRPEGQSEGRTQGRPHHAVKHDEEGASGTLAPEGPLPQGEGHHLRADVGGRAQPGGPLHGDLPDPGCVHGRRHGRDGDGLRHEQPLRGECDHEEKPHYEHQGSHFGSETSVHKDACCGQDSDVGLHEAFISAQEFSQALLNKNVNYACAPALCDDHDPFVKACNEQDFSFQRLRQLLEGAGLKKVRTERGDVIGGTGTMANYNTIGLFIHGGVYGITTRTKEHNSMTRYLNQFGRYHLGDQATWTSVTIAHNTETAIHHDFHNLEHSENYVVSFGQKKGGGLWVEDKSVTQERANNGNIQWRRDKSGRWLPGFVVDTKQKFLSFSPFLKHATEPWEGDRWCLVYHSTRNYAKIDDNLHAYLKKCCFPLPRRRRSTLAEPSPKKPSISTRRSIFNNAAKISVMMTTFLAAATSYLAGTVQVVHNDPHPVVLFEVGGTRVTEEAVMLGKDVFEPMDWDTYASPEGKETAYHVINGGLPKELRINLDGKRDGDNQAIAELLLQQVGVGGTAVLEGGMSDSLFGNHYFVTEVSKHLQYSSCNDGRQTMIFYKADHTKTKVKGPERVHRVCAVAVGADEAEAQRDVALDGTGVTFGEGTPPMIASALRRLHQNLGHPQNSDLIRHLRLAGCDGRILKAVRSLKCQVCDANVGPRIARPSVIPQLCDWNDTVGIDLFYAHDEKHTFLSAVDYGTSYHLAIRVDGQSSDDIEAKFNDMWIIPFGPPKSVVVDLDGGVQGALGRLCDWHNIAMKSIAAQSHWQAGMIERQQAWWKNIWERLVYQLTIGADEVDIAVPIVNSAKNDLRRRCGHSPSQWVFGRAPRLPEDLQDPDGGNHVSWDVSEDSRFQRQSAMRAAARVAGLS